MKVIKSSNLNINKVRSNIIILIILALSSFIGPFGGALLFPVFKEMSLDFNVAEVLIGLSIAFYMIPFSFFQLISGYISDRYDRKKIMVYGAVLYTVGALASFFSKDFTIFLLIRIIQGAGSALISPTTMALVGDFYSRDLRGKVMGILSASISLGSISGSFIGGFLGLINWRITFIAMTITGLILLILILLYLYDPRTPNFKETTNFITTYIRLLRNKLILVIGFSGAIVFFTRWSLNTFLSYVVRHPPYNLTSDVWGNILSLSGWGSLIASIVAGYLTDILGRRKVILIGLLLFLVTNSIFLIEIWFYYLFLLYLALGFFSSTIFTALGTLIIEVRDDLRATASSIYGSIRFLGYALGPILPIPIYNIYGILGVVTLNILLILFITLLWFIIIR